MLRYILDNLRKGPATRMYPAERRAPIEGSRGQLRNDANACVYCGLCAKRCPAGALEVTRKPDSWTLDPYRCIVCSYCVEVCPRKSLRMDPEHFVPPAPGA